MYLRPAIIKIWMPLSAPDICTMHMLNHNSLKVCLASVNGDDIQFL